MTTVRFDQATNAAVLVAVGLMLGNVLLGLGDWLRVSLDDALDVEFGGED